jgi:hypothetical protein
MCDCLAKHFYDISGGNIYRSVTNVTGTSFAAGDVIATAPASGTLYVTMISVSPSAAGITCDIGKSSEGDLFNALTWATYVQGPSIIDMMDGPYVLKNGETLVANTGGSGTIYVSVRGYQVSS